MCLTCNHDGAMHVLEYTKHDHNVPRRLGLNPQALKHDPLFCETPNQPCPSVTVRQEQRTRTPSLGGPKRRSMVFLADQIIRRVAPDVHTDAVCDTARCPH